MYYGNIYGTRKSVYGNYGRMKNAVLRKVESSCKGCTKRCVGCHSTCSDYADFLERRKKAALELSENCGAYYNAERQDTYRKMNGMNVKTLGKTYNYGGYVK